MQYKPNTNNAIHKMKYRYTQHFKALLYTTIIISGTLSTVSCLNNTSQKQTTQNKTSKQIYPTLDDIKFNTFKWDNVESTPNYKVWVNPSKTALISIQITQKTLEDSPNNWHNLKKVRSYYRGRIVNQTNGGLIHCNVIDLKGNIALDMVIKKPKQPTGLVYTGSLLIPFKTAYCTINIQAVEKESISGMRTASIFQRWFKENKTTAQKDDNGKIIGFTKDPYDASFRKGTLMNYAEQQKFDKDFPEHPLTITRQRLKDIKKSIVFSKKITHLMQ